jgi:hypothetical protein
MKRPREMSIVVKFGGGKNQTADGARLEEDNEVSAKKKRSDKEEKVNLLHTGALVDEVFTGRYATNTGVQMQFVLDAGDTGEYMLPVSDSARIIREWHAEERLMSLPRFRDMSSLEEGLEWIEAHASSSLTYSGVRDLSDVPHLHVRFLHLGYFDKTRKSALADPSRVDADTQQWLLTGVRKYADVLERLPFLVKDAPNGTLFGLMKSWCLYTGDPMVALPVPPTIGREPAIDPVSGEMFSAADRLPHSGQAVKKTMRSGHSVCILVPDEPPIQGRVAAALARDVWGRVGSGDDGDMLDTLVTVCADMSASELKSLMQKLIRFGARRVLVPARGRPFPFTSGAVTEEADAALVLTAVMSALACLPGYFLPDLGAYVTGVHSLAKRLLVILGEDAAPESVRPQQMLALATCALLSSEDTRWFPTLGQLTDWVTMGIAAAGAATCFRYSVQAGRVAAKFTLSPELLASKHHIGAASAMLDQIGSFDSDLALMRHIAAAGLVPTRLEGFARPQVMPLWHCYDHHVSGNLLYLLDTEAFSLVDRSYAQRVPASHVFYDAVYTKLFAMTKSNPRRAQLISPADPWWVAVKAAQLAYFVATHCRRGDTGAVPAATARDFAAELDDKWLAAMLGDQKHDGYYAALDIMSDGMVATRKPSRDGNDTVDETKRQEAITRLRERLAAAEGIAMRACDAPHPSLHHSAIRLTASGTYEVRQDGQFVPWDAAKRLTSRVPVRVDSQVTLDRVLGAVALPSAVPADDAAFRAVLAAADRPARVRLHQWLAAARGHLLHVPVISRVIAGSAGMAGRPMPIDVLRVFRQLLVPLLSLYPAALQPEVGTVTTFRVRDALVLSHVRAMVEQSLSTDAQPGGPSPWAYVKDTMPDRQELPFQQTAINELASRFTDRNLKRLLLWMEPGSGKTFIAFSFLRRVASAMPPYLLYAAPRCAHATVLKEMRHFGFKVITAENAGKMAAKLTPSLPPGTAVLLEHDWLRHPGLSQALEPILPQSFCLFDEVHKMLNATQRSSFAQGMAAACQGFIAFTGTPITSNDPLNLAAWLSLVLPYHVTQRNVWTSLGAFLRIESAFDVRMEGPRVVASDAAMLADREYLRLVRPLTTGAKFGPDDFVKLLRVAFKHNYAAMADAVLAEIRQPTRVPQAKQHASAPRTRRAAMVVVYNTADQKTMADELVKRSGGSLAPSDILLFGKFDKRRAKEVQRAGTDPTEQDYNAAYGIVDFTDETVGGGGRDYRVIIVPQSRDTGYSLSRCEHVFTAPYPSNEATRTQLRNRIRRVDQRAPFVELSVVTGGVLSRMYERQKEARSVAEALRMLTSRT